MCAPLGDIDKSGGLLRPEAFSALGDYGVSVCICPEEQRHALPDLSALQTRKPFLRVQHGRGFACAANGKGCILRNGEGGRVVKIQIEIAVIRSACGILDTDFSGNGDSIRILGRRNGTEPAIRRCFVIPAIPSRIFLIKGNPMRIEIIIIEMEGFRIAGVLIDFLCIRLHLAGKAEIGISLFFLIIFLIIHRIHRLPCLLRTADIACFIGIAERISIMHIQAEIHRYLLSAV